MSHDKVVAFCEPNKCKVEVAPKTETDAFDSRIVTCEDRLNAHDVVINNFDTNTGKLVVEATADTTPLQIGTYDFTFSEMSLNTLTAPKNGTDVGYIYPTMVCSEAPIFEFDNTPVFPATVTAVLSGMKCTYNVVNITFYQNDTQIGSAHVTNSATSISSQNIALIDDSPILVRMAGSGNYHGVLEVSSVDGGKLTIKTTSKKLYLKFT